MAASSPPRGTGPRNPALSSSASPKPCVSYPRPDCAAQPQHSAPVLWKHAVETMERWQLGCTREPLPSVGATRGAHTCLGCVSTTFCSATGAGQEVFTG